MTERSVRVSRLAAVAFASVAAFALLPGRSGLAQQGQPQILAPSAQDPWTGVIMGRVVDDATGEGIARAVTTASSTTLPGGDLANGGGGGRAVMTDSRGRFLFTNLPGSTFAITVEVRGYSPVDTVTTNRGAGFRIELPVGGRLTDLAVRMWRHAAISGLVLDDAQAPVVRQDVRAFRRSIVSGRSEFVSAGVTTTDDRGMYRISGLRPGQYAVGTTTEIDALPVSTYDRYRSLSGPAAADFSRQISMAGFNLFQGGAVVDELLVSAFPPANAMTGAGGRLFIYPPTFYPDVRTPDQAAILTLTSGEERPGVDLRLELTPTHRVHGTVSDAAGPVPNINVRLYPASADRSRSSELLTNSTATDQNGRFTFAGVTPGAYVAKILRMPMAGSSTATDSTLWARESIIVGPEDLAGVNLTVRTGFRITGRFEFVGRAPQPDRLVVQTMRYVIQQIDGVGAAQNGAFGLQSSFTTPEIPAGRYLVSILGKLKDWTFKSAMSGGRDVSEVPLDVRGDVSDLVLTFTDQPAQITGIVRDAQGVPAPSATVLVFPTDPERWRDYGPSPRSLQSTPASLTGTYLFRGLSAGEYYVVALTTPMADWQDEPTLQALARLATRVTLVDAESRSANLVANKPPGSSRAPATLEQEPPPHGPWVSDSDQAQSAPRDGRVAPTVGTSVMAGHVVTDESPSHPLRHAAVTARSVDANVVLSAITGDDGEFVFSALPAGRYTLTANKPPYVGGAFGATKPGMAGGVVVVADGQRVSDIMIKMWPGAVITGRINERPDIPVGRVTVSALQASTVNGATQWRAIGVSNVDDRGIYRIFGLAPGDYTVIASPTLQREIAPVPESDFEAVARGALPARSGTMTGRDVGRAAGTPQLSRTTPIPVFYRSALTPDSATVLMLRAGEERTGIDLDLQTASIASIQVTVLRPDGQTTTGVTPAVTSNWTAGPLTFGGIAGSRGTRFENGHFVIDGLPPGAYTVSARASETTGSADGVGGRGTQAPPPTLWAQSEVALNGQDVEITLQLQRGMTVSGRAVFDGQTVPPSPVVFRLAPAATGGPTAGITQALLKPDGTFEFVGVPPNRYRLVAMVPSGSWAARSALLDNVDVLDTPFDVVSGTNPSAIVARFTDKPAQISGTLRDKTNAPAPGYFIVIFPTDHAMWNSGSRRVRQTRPGTDGTFTIPLPPGEFYLCALTELDASSLSDASFLEQLVPSAIKITLREGETFQQDLKIGG